jgi:hypothetical protein
MRSQQDEQASSSEREQEPAVLANPWLHVCNVELDADHHEPEEAAKHVLGRHNRILFKADHTGKTMCRLRGVPAGKRVRCGQREAYQRYDATVIVANEAVTMLARNTMIPPRIKSNPLSTLSILKHLKSDLSDHCETDLQKANHASSTRMASNAHWMHPVGSLAAPWVNIGQQAAQRSAIGWQ